MDTKKFYRKIRSDNEKQKSLLLYAISHLQSINPQPLQIFFTGPAGYGKTYVIILLKEIYNRFTDNDGFFNSDITCATTGKAAVAIDGTTVHFALSINTKSDFIKELPSLSKEALHQYRSIFKYVKVIIIDEISMMGAVTRNG